MTMLSAHVSEPHKLEFTTQSIPKIKQNTDVLIKVHAVGICGSDVHIYHGTSPVAVYPRILGHEIAAEVVAVGSQVTTLKKEDKVVVEPMIACLKCYACHHGRPNACQDLKVRGCHVDGGFREYMVVPESALFKFNDDIPWEQAALIEPYTIASQVTWRADIQKGDYVFIMGAGPIGQTILEYTKYRGGIAIISDIQDNRLALAKELGADYILNPLKDDIKENIFNITKAMGANVVIDAVCTTSSFAQTVEYISVAGRIMCLGFIDEPSFIPQLPITLKELDIRGSRHQTFKFREVVPLFNQKIFHPEKLISHIMDFKEAQKAFDLIDKNPSDVVKVILKMG